MADNVTFTTTLASPPSGIIVAADDISSTLFPRGKLVIGADGVNDGDVSAANPLPCTDAGVGGVSDAASSAGGTGSVSAKLRLVTTQLSTLDGRVDGVETFLDVLDDWDESDRAKVNPIVGQAGVAAGAGAVAATVQRMTLASDDPAVSVLGATGDSAASAGGTGSLSAKLRLITTQLNTQAGYLDGLEGHVDGVETLLAGGLPAALGQGTMSQGLRVVLPSDQTGLPPKTLSVSGSTDVAAVIFTQEVGDYRWVAVQITGAGGNTDLFFEGSNDNSTWVQVDVAEVHDASSVASRWTNWGNTIYQGAVPTRYFRARANSISSGTVTATAWFSASPAAFQPTLFASLGGDTDGGTPTVLFGLGGLKVHTYQYNNATWERPRSNHEVSVLASAARTASVNSADLTNYNARGVVVVVDVTAVTATPSLVVTLAGKDTLSGQYLPYLDSAAITGTGQTILTVYPGCIAVANRLVNHPLPRVWRVQVVAADTDSITYSVGANYIN